jgi:hypothetical protein
MSTDIVARCWRVWDQSRHLGGPRTSNPAEVWHTQKSRRSCSALYRPLPRRCRPTSAIYTLGGNRRSASSIDTAVRREKRRPEDRGAAGQGNQPGEEVCGGRTGVGECRCYTCAKCSVGRSSGASECYATPAPYRGAGVAAGAAVEGMVSQRREAEAGYSRMQSDRAPRPVERGGVA